jgi:hypothetical protein
MARLTETTEWAEDIYRLEITDDAIGGEDGLANRQAKQLGSRTRYLKAAVEAEEAARQVAVQNEAATRTAGMAAVAGRLNALEGRGGPLQAHDFGSETPTQEELTEYACEQIWGEGGVLSWDAETPAESTYEVEGVVHQVSKINGGNEEIFNATWVRNTYNNLNHRIELVNTPDTLPAVFSWEDVGIDTVAVATAELPGVVRSGGDIEVDPVTGEVTLVGQNVYSRDKNRSAPLLFASDKRILKVRAWTSLSLTVSGVKKVFTPVADLELDIAAILDTGSLAGGKDYYVFLVPGESDTLTFKASLAKEAPSGLTAGEVYCIGGFHTLCANVGSALTYVYGGETVLHPLNGFVAGDILPASVWCLNHRPYSEPEGMVYIDSLDFWCDIYLQSGSGVNTKSVYQGAITRSRQYVDFVEDQFCVKKELLDDGEFAAAMLGSNEQTAVSGASESGATTGGAGGRSDTAGRRMISVYGVEEGCGSLWQWLATTSAAGAAGVIYGQTAATPAYGWITMTQSSYGVYGQSGGKGSLWGLVGSLLAGGYWSHGAACGSRARAASNARSYANASVGGRGRSRALHA